MRSLILRASARLLFTLMLLFAFFLLWRGHNEPGGGFVGGLVAAAAFILIAIADGPAAARTAVRVDPRNMIAVGLLVAIASGAIALFDREPVLTAQWDTVHLLGLPEFTVGTPLMFDIGVFIVVLGVTLTIILALAEE